MTKIVYITPADGYVLTDPATWKTIPATGVAVEYSTYWFRRANEGGCTISDIPTVSETEINESLNVEDSTEIKE